MLLLLAFSVLLGACDSDDPTIPPPTDAFPLNPDTTDFDAIQNLGFNEYVQPLLAYRNVFGMSGDTPEDRLDSYAWEALFEGDTPEGATVIPFDADESLLLKFVERLADSVAIPYPALRDLEDDERRYLRRWIEAGAQSSDGDIPFADAGVVLYVANQLSNRVAIIDAERRQVIRYVYFAPFGEGVGNTMGAKPHDTAVSGDGSAWFVTLIDGTGGGSILKLSTDLTLDPGDSTYLLATEQPPAGEGTFEKPGMIWSDAANGGLFAGRSFSAAATSQGIASLDPADLSFDVYPTLNVNHPHAVAVTLNGEWLLTASLDVNNTVSVISADTGDLVDQLEIEGDERSFVQFSVSPDGRTVALTSQSGAVVYFFEVDPDSGEITLLGEVAVGEEPWHPMFSPDGETLYVPNRISHTVSFVDVASRSVSLTVSNDGLVDADPLSEPHGSAVMNNGQYLFVSNRNLNVGLWTPPYPFLGSGGQPLANTDMGNVMVIDTQTGDIVEVIPVGKWASGMSIYDRR